MRNLIGELIGRYKIIEQIGKGGMAVVYKASDTVLGRNVAIKMILPDQQQTEKYLKRFSREAKILAQLSHPSIVRILDFGNFEEVPYLIMEYVGGGSLSLEKNRDLSPSEILSMIAKIAHALNFSHQKKIIHRDIKPSNILFNESGQPLLTDFGIAKLTESDESQSLTSTGAAVGTPAYMSPEQIQGKPIDGRSDIYSLGVVLFELLTNRKPYLANTPIEIALKHLNESTPHCRQINRNLSPEVDQVVYKAMAKNVSDRYQDMETFAIALEQLSSERKQKDNKKTTPKSNEEKTGFWKKLTPLARFSMVGGLIALLAILFMVFNPFGLSPVSKKNDVPTLAQEITDAIPTNTASVMPTFSDKETITAEPSISQETITQTPENTNLDLSSKRIQLSNINKVISLENMEKVPVIKLSWAPDGQWLLNAGGKALRLINPIGMKTNTTINLDGIPKDIAVSPDGKRIFVLLGNTIQIFNAQTYKPVSDFEFINGGANSIAVSPDQKTIAVGMLDNKVELHNIENGSTTRLFRSNFGGWSVDFSQDGKMISVGTSMGVLMWDVESGAWLPIETGQNDFVKAVAFSHNGKYIASGAEDIIRIWNVATGEEINRYDGDFGIVYSISFSPDDRLLASGSDDGVVRLWSVQNSDTTQELRKHTSAVYSVAFSPNGERLATGEVNGNIYIWGVP